jgi:glutathionyl-hydroquinone reductase
VTTAGAFVRQQAAFRGWVEPGAPPSRYHLYVALACPWSHRTVIVRRLEGLEDELYQRPGVADTVAMDQIREHYYTTHDSLNPKRIIPRGPLDVDFTAPHGRS